MGINKIISLVILSCLIVSGCSYTKSNNTPIDNSNVNKNTVLETPLISSPTPLPSSVPQSTLKTQLPKSQYNTAEQSRTLTVEEIANFENELGDISNCGFLTCEYSEPSKINPNEVFYNGCGFSMDISETEKKT